MSKKIVTLVAYYGKSKPILLQNLILALQKNIEQQIGSSKFEKYPLEQVHGTIIGLEGKPIDGVILNTNYLQASRIECQINLPDVLNWALTTNLLPLMIRIGGYDPSQAYPFASRNFHPYLRSFSIQGDIAVAMGWPVRKLSNGRTYYPMDIDDLRRSFNDYNVLHKYHKAETDIDNDFFFVLGNVRRDQLTRTDTMRLQRVMRDVLYRYKPVDIVIKPINLSLVVYTDPKLPPPPKSKVFPLSSFPIGPGGRPQIGKWKQWYK